MSDCTGGKNRLPEPGLDEDIVVTGVVEEMESGGNTNDI